MRNSFVPILLLSVACTAGTPPEEAEPSLKTDKGVDAAAQVIRVGMLNDESGPAAVIGTPYANGKRLLAARINAGGSGLLPEGWKLQLVERDHGYNPQQSVQLYEEIRDQVLYVGTSFGTPNTLPLRPKLEEDKMVAFPASLSSQMASNDFTPPLGTSYMLEAERAMDFVVEQAEGAENVKAGIVYQQDDYGKDGLAGWKKAAERHGVSIISEQTVDPGQKDMAAVITGLKDAGATHVLLTLLPSSSGPIVGTAAQLQYAPMWIGTTGAWIDSFMNPEVIPSAVFGNYYQMTSFPYWGEDVPGMDDFQSTFEAHGTDMSQDWYVLLSYLQGLSQVEAAKRAIEGGDVTREGYLAALKSMKAFDAGGLIRPIDLSKSPYEVSREVRVLKPDFEGKTWTVAMDYGEPGVTPKERPGQDAMEDEANAMHPPGEGGD
ncbi:MAG: ABC transporter substrate-binding protein [Myxococcales bacterium]|nr:ABC transporter substrate-binding protein [Myxococcales bacterium]